MARTLPLRSEKTNSGQEVASGQNNMINLCQPRQPGDILRLHGPIGDIEPDTYVLLSLGDTCCLALLGENEAGQR